MLTEFSSAYVTLLFNDFYSVIHTGESGFLSGQKKNRIFYFHQIETKYHLSFWSFSRIKCKTL